MAPRLTRMYTVPSLFVTGFHAWTPTLMGAKGPILIGLRSHVQPPIPSPWNEKCIHISVEKIHRSMTQDSLFDTQVHRITNAKHKK
jgi:hypothetical protein